jgi:hypothetical protein
MFEPRTMTLEVECVSCKKTTKLYVRDVDYSVWVRGYGLVQNVFPYLSAGERELLISQICDDCWNRMFRDE